MNNWPAEPPICTCGCIVRRMYIRLLAVQNEECLDRLEERGYDLDDLDDLRAHLREFVDAILEDD